MNLAFIMVKTASGVYTLTYRRNNVTSSRRREYMNNMTSWYLHLNVNIFVNFWISWEMKISLRSWKTRLFEYVKFRKSIFYYLRALFSRRQSYVLVQTPNFDLLLGIHATGQLGVFCMPSVSCTRTWFAGRRPGRNRISDFLIRSQKCYTMFFVLRYLETFLPLTHAGNK